MRANKIISIVLSCSLMLGIFPTSVDAYADTLRAREAAGVAAGAEVFDAASSAEADGIAAIAEEPVPAVEPLTNGEGAAGNGAAPGETAALDEGSAAPAPDAATSAAESAAPAAELAVAAATTLEGRDFVGQATKTINGVEYILIGNEQQLRAIGSGKPVVAGPVYAIEQQWNLGKARWEDTPGATPQLVYPGDADLDAATALRGSKVDDHDGANIARPRTKFFTLNPDGTRNDDISSLNTGATYAADAHYLIFRDIDLGANAADSANTAWTPLMFSSIMLGAKSAAPDTAGSLWDTVSADGKGITDVNAVANPVISNVNVHQSGELDVRDYTGIGFFGTISNKISDTEPFAAPTQAKVSNITLSNVSVVNDSTKVHVSQTLISALIGGLGAVVGGLLAELLKILTLGKVDLTGLVESLLTIRAADPTSLATGAFAGRVVGDVVVSGCEVEQAHVSSVAPMVGGFVGSVQGETVYEILSKLLGSIVKLLSNLLNIIPGVGLGDLITLLLDNNIIAAGELVPVDYLNPIISDCAVNEFAPGEALGSASCDYAGGFAGVMVGTVAQNCSVTSTNPYTVNACLYAGGFAGLMRNDVMKGALTQLGVEVRLAQPQSAAFGCSVSADVTVTAVSYAGGFAGALANSYVVDGATAGALSVEATGHQPDSTAPVKKAIAGGFVGAASVGWICDLGQGENKNSDLLSGVNNLLNSLLTSDPAAAQNLLSLVGVEESAVLGAQMSGGPIAVHSANDCAGGLVGRGDAAVIAASDKAHLDEIKLWFHGVVTHAPLSRGVSVEGLQSVAADGSFAGGIAGQLGTASVGGLINDTVGLGGYLPFTLSSTSVTGTAGGFSVSAGGSCAAGGVGKATGGRVARADAASAPATAVVSVNELKDVTAGNNAGGFAGVMGPGDLAATGGLDLLGLHAIAVNGLLAVADGMAVDASGVDVNGVAAGMTVKATGANALGETTQYAAGGFVASSNSARLHDVHVADLARVEADMEYGNAGGFVGISRTGGLAEVADEAAIGHLIDVGGANGLVNAVGYMIPSYTNADVRYINGGSAAANVAGGFAGDFQSGTVDNAEKGADDAWAVYNVDAVTGGSYAGGFGGKIHSGALAAADGGVSILGGLGALNIGVDDLLSVVGAYVPFVKNAGVKSDASTLEATSGAQPSDAANAGFVVSSSRLDQLDSQSGSAGGFVGYGSGMQVSNCNVTQLRHTAVTEPAELEGADGSPYFDAAQSAYAVAAPRFAGGFVGKMDIGSAASVGKGLNVLGQAIKLTDVAGALSVVVSTIEHSDVTGGVGGFSVLASETSQPDGALGGGQADPGSAANPVGSSGGFAGAIKGGHIQDSSSLNFAYIIGQVAAGGYVGDMAPGDAASVLADNSSILVGLVGTNGALASLLQDFVPTIRNSKTTCTPCGGAVRAQAPSDITVLRGMAGGYAGHNEGGHIWGSNNAPWKQENDASNHYEGEQRLASAERIRSVYGQEFAGGYTGIMEPADTAAAGSLNLLFGLVEAGNVLGALEVAYPTEENTQVTGPLRGMAYTDWNAWAEHVGAHGGYGSSIAAEAGHAFATQEEFDDFIASYVYGTTVVAGRPAFEQGANVARGGVAGGYAGLMHGGTVTHATAVDTKAVTALRAAGGFAGAMETADMVSLGSVDLLNLINVNLGSLVSALDVLVPVAKSSSVMGYRKGMVVAATGTDLTHEQGFAGGYVGYASGAQIWGDATFADANKAGDRWTAGATHEGYTPQGCNAENVRKVYGANCIGGYAGMITAAGVADVNTNASEGLLQKLLDAVIATPSSVASVLNATMSTVRGAKASAVDGTTDPSAAAWGFTVDGAYTAADGSTAYARAAGGFAGAMKAAVAGTSDGGTCATDTLSVVGLRGVEAGQYAGGFVGQADVTAVASVAGAPDQDQSTNLLLKLIKAGNIGAIEAFRPYIYHANVGGVADGIQVRAHDSSTCGILASKQFTGTAGGFAGAVIDGSVKRCAVTDLASVSGVNYVGGFVGHLGKAGTVDVDNAQVNGLLGATAGVLDVWGSHVEDSSVAGVADGYAVSASHQGADYALGTDRATGREVTGGFAGYADLARVSGCTAGNLAKVESGEIAGGFVGETTMAYVADAGVSFVLLDLVLGIVNALVNLLYLDNLQDLGVIDLGAWIPGLGKLFDLKVFGGGNVLYVNLFGLKISVQLSKASAENQQQTDVAIVTIGDTSVKLPCSNGGLNTDPTVCENLKVSLIKGNRTKVVDCTVAGIASGYDVFGGGATQHTDGVENRPTGYAAGFVGLNKEGVLHGNEMFYADVVRGTSGLVDPFSNSTLKSAWDFNTLDKIIGANSEGAYNVYHVYRAFSGSFDHAQAANGDLVGPMVQDAGAGTFDTGLSRYDVKYFSNAALSKFSGLKDAVQTGAQTAALDAYASPAKAVLMMDTPILGAGGALTPEPDEGQDPCEALVDVTISKVWNDRHDFDKIRPDAIRLQLTGSYIDAAGTKTVPAELRYEHADGTVTPVANPQVIELTRTDASGWTETWSKVVSGMPVAFDDAGTVRYYAYEVVETEVRVNGQWIPLEQSGYGPTYGVNDAEQAFSVVNTHIPTLPETGGYGALLLTLLALAAMGAGYLYLRRRMVLAEDLPRPPRCYER